MLSAPNDTGGFAIADTRLAVRMDIHMNNSPSGACGLPRTWTPRHHHARRILRTETPAARACRSEPASTLTPAKKSRRVL